MAIEEIKRKNGKVYRVRYVQNGERLSRCFDRYYDAVQFEKEARANVILKINKDLTFKEASEEWLANHAEIHKTPSTVAKDKVTLKNDILPRIGKLRLSEVTPDHIEHIVIAIKKEKLSNSTLKKKVGIVSAIFNYFIRKRATTFNPVSAISRIKEEERKFQYWTLGEANRFLEYTQRKYKGTHRYGIYLLYKVALHTGMRMGELLALKWSEIDFENRLITVCRSYCYFEREIKETTKSRKIRHIPLSSAIFQELQEAHADKTSDLVIHIDGQIIDKSNLRHRYFERDIKAAGVKRIRFHDLRHTYASHFMMNGGNPYALQAILGHSELRMTERYAHLSKAYLADKNDLVRFGEANVVQVDFKKVDDGSK